ncbi:MAG: glutamyl-tRNA reductase [Deltaproteobacteria bacterium]|jgi:glutamyl-tRNA reductase|nr:glutamyl-tRNA reductase [Deltaproteobacteria bacterium]
MKQDIWLIGLSYKTAPVEIRERFALNQPNPEDSELIPLDEAVSECMILSTCNRVEILSVSSLEDPAPYLLKRWAGGLGEPGEALAPYVYVHKGDNAVRHLFSVASSLDSMILGEPQILGQLKDAYRSALERNRAKTVLNRLLHKSFSVAKKVRTRTNIAASAVSVSYAAVELAKRIFGDMRDTNVLLVGAGEMAELAATHFMNAGIRALSVTNRTAERAEQLARAFGGEAVPFENLPEALARTDIVLSSTGASKQIISSELVRPLLKKRRNRPMFFIDIAVPRDIDPLINALDNVYLYDIDDLKEVVEENLAQRREEALKARALVDGETEAFRRWLASLDLQPTIVDIVRRGERIAGEETEKALKRLGAISEEQREAVAAMAAAIVKKCNHDPISFLRLNCTGQDADMPTLNSVRRLFSLDRTDPPDSSPANSALPLKD